MGKHLVLVGGGHAHMVTLANLHQFIEKGHRVTVVGPSEYHYYSGMGPGMLGGTYTPEEIRFATRLVVERKGGVFVKGRAVRIDPDKRVISLESGATISYDLLSCNTGSYVPSSTICSPYMPNKDIFSVKPIEKLMDAKKAFIAKLSQNRLKTVSIIGGGPSSAEIAGNVWQLAVNYCTMNSTDSDSKNIIADSKNFEIQNSHIVPYIKNMIPQINIFAGKKFMSNFPENIRRMVVTTMKNRGVHIFEEGYVKRIDNDYIVVGSGSRYQSDFIFIALGIKPSDIFKESGLPIGPDQGLLVNKFLQSTRYPEIFGGGDCIYFKDSPLDKVGVYAVRQNPVLFHNLMACLDNQPLQQFNSGEEYLLVFNLGGGYGVLKKKWFSLKGRPAFIVKDLIDRKFMKRFQALEE
ncbi:MAG: FAD-dependent oxidoreductase [Desulfamplus sp.]|nr:FAD-dependent oxidoreductase [Desulfamplus sp.]